MYSILLYEVEPLFPRGPGEIDPGVKGPHAHGEPLPLPYPTSLAGTLITVLYNLGCLPNISKASSVEEWFRDFEDFYEWIKGPYIAVILGNNVASLLVSASSGWVRLEDLYKTLPKLLKLWSEKGFGEEYFNVRERLVEKVISLSEVLEERVCIALEYYGKVVREHYLTTLRLINYGKLVDKPLRGKAKVVIGVDVNVRNSDVLSCIKGRVVVRVSGRGRGGVLELRKGNVLGEEIRKLHSSWETPIGDGTFLLYVASPLILSLKSNLNDLGKQFSIYPRAESIYEFLKKELELICDVKGCVECLSIDGVVTTCGLGYSLRFNERKTLHNIISPGSLIFVKVRNCKAKPKDIYTKGLGYLKHLGFGTVLPIS